MDTPVSDKPTEGKAKRVFLRIPVKFPAKILIPDSPDKEVCVDELSTTGLSFYLKESENIPDYFELAFRLGPFSKIIKIKLEVKSRNSISGTLRIGCRFVEVLDEDKKQITNYICKFADLSLPVRVVGVASFFCSLDSLWRIAAYLLYYNGVKFEKGFRIPLADYFYFLILLLYAITTFAAFIFSGRVTNKKEKALFLTSLFCLILAFIFIMIKNIVYWKFWIGHSEYLFVSALFWTYLLFSCYTLLSILIGMLSLKKMNSILDILDQHITSLAAEKVKI